MAKGKGQINGWITKNGVHIPIYGAYTVRGGEEPKAKGAKFKRRKRPEEFDKDIRETEGGKFMAQYSSDQGRKKGVKDIEKPFETREGARKFLAEENGEYEDSKFTSKAESGQKKDKYANRDFSSDLASAHKAGYSEQTEEGIKSQKKSYTRDELDGRPESLVGKKGVTNTQMLERELERHPNDEHTAEIKQRLERSKAYDRDHTSGQASSTPTEPYAKSNNKYLGQSVKDLNKLDVRNLNDSELSQLREHASASSRTGARGADKLWKNVDAEINRRAMGQESSTSSFSPESSAKAINDMARRRANGGGKNDDWKTAQSVLESAPAGTTMIQTGNRGVKFQYTKGQDGTWHSSAGSEYDSDSKKLSMSWVGESGPSVEFTTSDKALSNEDIKASHDAATSGRLNQALGLDRNNRPIGNRSTRKVDTSTSTSKSYPWTKSTVEPAASELGRAYSEANKAKEKFTGMSVTALKSAYKNAVGSERGAIYQLLKAKGYRIVNGKWMKG